MGQGLGDLETDIFYIFPFVPLKAALFFSIGVGVSDPKYLGEKMEKDLSLLLPLLALLWSALAFLEPAGGLSVPVGGVLACIFRHHQAELSYDIFCKAQVQLTNSI